jgi:ADP-heptose:LPS heptosyltransferase
LCSKDIKNSTFQKPINNYNGVKSLIFNLKMFLGHDFKMIKFSINNISKKYHDEAKRLLPGSNYVGFAVTQGNTYRKKSWEIDSFIELGRRLNLEGKKIVFFIEKSEINLVNYIKNKLPESLFPEHESKISCPALVTALAARLEKAITIDNGIMHMIGITDVPMIILFGPTNSEKFAPKRSNILILDSKEMYNSEDINKITVEDVITIYKKT